jgi:site-specific recombinase XerD
MRDNLTSQKRPRANALQVSYTAFMLSRQAMRCTAKTLEHYRYTAGGFVAWLTAHGVTTPQDITPDHIRAYFVTLQERNTNDTTQHAHARGIKTWLYWLVDEGDLDASPMRKVAMPRLDKRIPAPFSPENVETLLDSCDRKTYTGARDYALLLALLDTGLRASELLSLRVGDIDMRTGLATVMGKGNKQRQVRAGAKARAAIVRMLAHRDAVTTGAPLWLAIGHPEREDPGALTLQGLQTLLHRMGKAEGILPCSPHRFRRTFALWMLRDGCDLHSLRLLMGHSDLTVLQRYLALAGEDIERAHMAHSPADKLLGPRSVAKKGR